MIQIKNTHNKYEIHYYACGWCDCQYRIKTYSAASLEDAIDKCRLEGQYNNEYVMLDSIVIFKNNEK